MRRVGMLVPGVLLLIAGPAIAQDTSRAEVSVGWRYYHADLGNTVYPIAVIQPKDYPKGWYADAAVNLAPTFAILSETGGTYFSDKISSTTNFASIRESYELSFHTFMGGVRVRAPQIRWLVPFGQILFGGERDSSTEERTVTVVQNSSTFRQEASGMNAALALETGVTIAAGVIGMRAAVGYARLFSNFDADTFRFSLGSAFRF